jgi:hypothetical protein
MAWKATESWDDRTNNVVVSDVIIGSDFQAWSIAEPLIDASLISSLSILESDSKG